MSVIPLLAASLLAASTLVQQPAASPAPDQQSSIPDQLSFKFDRPVAGVPVPHYTIIIREDGSGAYRAETVTAGSPDPQAVERPLTFSPAAVKSVFGWLGQMRTSNASCASKVKNIADTGTKTLTYPDGTCTYNYSENKAVVQLTEMFLEIEFTLEEGRTLDFKHRFDRLGLDAEMAILVAAVESGRAKELGNIAPTLRLIAGDTELIERVRLRASKLLERAEAGG